MKEIKVKYFGVLTDITKKEEDVLRVNLQKLQDFEKVLEEKYPGLTKEEYQTAINGKIVAANAVIDEDVLEIALLPAFSGG